MFLTLAAGASYAYTAYSDSACGATLASAAFKTHLSVSNLGQTSASVALAVGNDDQGNSTQWAIGFTTGPRSGGYTLLSVSALFAAQGGSPGNITVAVHAASGSNPGALVTTLTGDNPATAGTHEFTCSGSCSLSASTTYIIVMSATATGNGANYKWRYTTSDNETTVPTDSGWSIANSERVKQNQGNWTQDNDSAKFQVTAY